MVPDHAMLVVFLASVWWLKCPCQGRVLDEDRGRQEAWPVLCPPDTYYNILKENCVACSGCPINEIITNPCHDFQDTECGPFYEYKSLFSDMSKQPSDSKETSGTSGSVGNSNSRGDKLKDTKTIGHNTDRLKSQEDDLPSDNVNTNSEWRSLTMTLSVLISVLCVVIFVIVVVICCKRRKIHGDRKELVCEYKPPPVDV